VSATKHQSGQGSSQPMRFEITAGLKEHQPRSSKVLTPYLSLCAADVGTEEDPWWRAESCSFHGPARPGETVGASDGQAIERFGVHWLIGYQTEVPG
jgi:hypothetical protein